MPANNKLKIDASLRKELRSIAGKLERLIQRKIRELDLIDTGLMLKSIKVRPVETITGFELQVDAVEYFTYHRELIMEEVYLSPEWQDIEDRLANVYAALVEIDLGDFNGLN